MPPPFCLSKTSKRLLIFQDKQPRYFMASAPSTLRSELHELIDSIQNQSVLAALHTLLSAQQAADHPPVVLSIPEAAAVAVAIEEALQQSANGEGRPHADVMRELRARYGAEA